MMRDSAFKYSRPVFWFVAVLLVSLVAADVVIVSQQRRFLKDIRQNDVRNELDLMGALVHEALLKHDYGTVENFLIQWGKEHPDVLEIRAIAPNNFVLVEYKSPLPVKHFYRAQQKVSYEGEYLITLELAKDFSMIEKSLNKLSFKLIGGSVIFIGLLGLFLWYTVNITAMKPLEKEIAERKKADELLQESEKRYRMLFETAGDAIFILEAEGEEAGKIVALNKTAAKMHGYAVDELINKNIRELDTPQTAQNAPHLMRRILGGERIQFHEVTHRRKNGTVFFAEVNAGLLEIGDHKLVLAFDRDITERKIAEYQLLHTQQTLKTILSATPYGVVVMGMDKKVRSANKAALDLMGYDSEEQIVGEICNKSFCPTEDDKCPLIDLHTTVDQAEKIIITKDGKRIPILKTVVPIEIEGEQVLLEAFIDITDQKSAEQKLQQYAAELKQSNEDVLSFSYIVSHDLRAPLVSIKGFAGELQYALQEIEPILDRCMPHLSEQDRTQLATTYRKDVPVAMDFITSSVGRMDGLINAVLVLSRLGHRELKPEPLNVTALAKSILSSLAHQIEQRKTVVTIGDLPIITADKLAMEQIMGNLLDNALKYLDPVRAGEITVTAERNEEEVVFHVIDNGRGIAQEDMHKVFEIFRRAGKQDVPGEGMGLAYVKMLVRRQGGRIWCESEPGKGTTFSFTIPHPAAVRA
ncbi:MAG: PAS domain S-box protein [Nitrospirae bacterium]|nr:PAS domain S-box protein [Nitrospirota bacterium]